MINALFIQQMPSLLGNQVLVLYDLEPHYCLAAFVYHGTKISEEKAEIQKYGSAHTVAVNVLQMSPKSFDFIHHCFYNYLAHL
jgi:hypothetical protein